MRWCSAVRLAVVVASLVVLGGSPVAAGDLPVVKGKTIVATVQGEHVSLDALDEEVALAQEESGVPADASLQRLVLDRMINVLLIAQEARRMGLDTLPEVKRVVESNAFFALRDELARRTVKDLKPDPKQVEDAYRDAVRQWKVNAVLFDTDEHAKSFAAELTGPSKLVELGKTYVAAGKAKRVDEDIVLTQKTMDPGVAKTVVTMAAGATSGVISTRSGPVILELEEVQYPDTPATRLAVERKIAGAVRLDAVRALNEALKKKYAKIDHDLVKKLDYEAPTPGIEALRKDKRVLAKIKGEKPITVGDLTEQLRFSFFHGVEAAAQLKHLNAKKEDALERMLHRRLFRKEALRLGLDKTDAYRRRIKDFEDAVLFEEALKKVIAPELKLREEQVKTYYDEHRQEYTTPEMIRIKSLAFAARASAESAVTSLKKGAEFEWVADHAEGQLGADTTGLLTFDGRPIMTTQLPEGVQKAVVAAKPGDVRIYTSPESHVYVLAIQDIVRAVPRPYDDVRGAIRTKVANAAFEEAVERYAQKLRTLSDVKVYLR